jgi:hypothetical protein
MNSSTIEQASRIRLYWSAWLGVVAFALVLRFTVFLGANSNRLFALASAYTLGTWLPVMVLHVIEGRKLLSYGYITQKSGHGSRTLRVLAQGCTMVSERCPGFFRECDRFRGARTGLLDRLGGVIACVVSL